MSCAVWKREKSWDERLKICTTVGVAEVHVGCWGTIQHFDRIIHQPLGNASINPTGDLESMEGRRGGIYGTGCSWEGKSRQRVGVI